MHKIFLCSLFFLVVISFFANAQKQQKYTSKKKTLHIKTKIYCDHCVKCESCKSRVENKVYELKGIRSVEMNVKKETIEVIYNPKFVDAQKIKEQVASTGFDADDIKANATQIAGLDECCQKK